MRIDPSQISAPLAHILKSGATDAAGGQRTTDSARIAAQPGQMERLDQLLLKRMRASAMLDAANSVISFEEAKERLSAVQEQAKINPEQARGAQGELDYRRVRDLLS